MKSSCSFKIMIITVIIITSVHNAFSSDSFSFKFSGDIDQSYLKLVESYFISNNGSMKIKYCSLDYNEILFDYNEIINKEYYYSSRGIKIEDLLTFRFSIKKHDIGIFNYYILYSSDFDISRNNRYILAISPDNNIYGIYGFCEKEINNKIDNNNNINYIIMQINNYIADTNISILTDDIIQELVLLLSNIIYMEKIPVIISDPITALFALKENNVTKKYEKIDNIIMKVKKINNEYHVIFYIWTLLDGGVYRITLVLGDNKKERIKAIEIKNVSLYSGVNYGM